MLSNFFRLFLLIFLISTGVSAAAAQSSANDKDAKEEMPKGIKETLAKQRIAQEKKDFDELLAHGEEALKISGELEESFVKNNSFSTTDQKKLDRLEKVVKKIRNELGSDDDEQIEEKPLSLINALKILQSNTLKLVDELKKNSRYSVSVVAIESSNALLSLVRFLRFKRN